VVAQTGGSRQALFWATKSIMLDCLPPMLNKAGMTWGQQVELAAMTVQEGRLARQPLEAPARAVQSTELVALQRRQGNPCPNGTASRSIWEQVPQLFERRSVVRELGLHLAPRLRDPVCDQDATKTGLVAFELRQLFVVVLQSSRTTFNDEPPSACLRHDVPSRLPGAVTVEWPVPHRCLL